MGDILRFDKDRSNDDYEPTDSEDEYSEGEKELLKEVRERNKRDVNEKQELMAFDDSDDEEEQNDDDEDDDDEADMNDSDIEGAEDDAAGIPDSKDWGSKSRNYYNTDFVDQDYSTYNEQEEEMAKQEEEEAKIIQMRLAKQMKEEDFQFDDVLGGLGEDEGVDQKSLKDSITMPSDLSGLTKREKQRLFQKDSPEFPGLVSDFEKYLAEEEQLLKPVLSYVQANRVPMIPALRFAQLYQNITWTYCSNVAFYLLLKARRVNVRNHPITKRLVQLKKLLVQLSDKHENIIRPQLEALLERIQDGDEIVIKDVQELDAPKAKSKKTKLSIMSQYDDGEDEGPMGKRRKLQEEQESDEDDEDDEEGEEGEEAKAAADEEERRGITYQIAKNKGLRVHRKKEQRNPRVKHRSKFRKALIRRKGAVRTVRKETQRYGGEISGIKATVSKSIKFKT